MTWSEFKKRVEDNGVKDESVIWFIDVNGMSLIEDINISAGGYDGSISIWG